MPSECCQLGNLFLACQKTDTQSEMPSNFVLCGTQPRMFPTFSTHFLGTWEYLGMVRISCQVRLPKGAIRGLDLRILRESTWTIQELWSCLRGQICQAEVWGSILRGAEQALVPRVGSNLLPSTVVIWGKNGNVCAFALQV